MTPKEHARQIRLTGLGFSLLVLTFANLGSFSLNISEYARFGVVLLLTGLTYGVFEFAARATLKNTETKQAALKIIASLTAIAILTCAISAAISITKPPFDEAGMKFVYENTATAAGITAWILTVLLSILQKDIYWINRRKNAQFDERLIKERQEIFETSYKIGAFLTVQTILLINISVPKMIEIASATNSQSIPGAFYWILISLLTALYALPLTIAAWKNK